MKVSRLTRILLLVSLSTLSASLLTAQMSVSLSASVGSNVPLSAPVNLGTPVTWTASVSGAGSGSLIYRFQTRPSGGNFRTVVDYGPKSALTWTTINQEGTYQVGVSVINIATGEQAAATATQVFNPLINGTAQGITPSANPLVFIYSTPACSPGSRMRVSFQSSGGYTQTTAFKPCLSGSTMNFYLAGMQPGAHYNVQQTIDGRPPSTEPATTFTAAGASANPLTFTPLNGTASPQGLLVQSVFGQSSIATDLSGNLVWTSPGDISYLTRTVTGGTFLAIFEDGTQDPSQQFFREFDLAGIPVAETNAAQVNRQLANLGVHAINGFHHEARKLPGGGYLVLADSERILTNVQGPGPIDVIGDTILVLNRDLQVTWAWDAFDHLDPYRLATLGETCTYPAGLACAPFYLNTKANDWLHGNALQLTPDGNILYSVRHQDWVIKINYAKGSGDGEILWRMGASGDFKMVSNDLHPWFSHQHDPNFEFSNKVLLVFDDGNIRNAADPTANSRGQALQVDEENRVVTTLLNANLGVYSPALGSAQLLPGGKFNFDAGLLVTGVVNGNVQYAADSFQVEPSGAIDFGLQFNTLEYRTFRVPDLYTDPDDALLRPSIHTRIGP